MANYNQSAISGAKWLRAKLVTVINEFGKMPSIVFGEEEVMQLEGSADVIKLTETSPRHPLVEDFSNPAEQFDLLDPDTDAVIGTAHYADIRTMLYSMYRHVALKRDTAPVVVIPPTPIYVPPAPPVVEPAPAGPSPVDPAPAPAP